MFSSHGFQNGDIETETNLTVYKMSITKKKTFLFNFNHFRILECTGNCRSKTLSTKLPFAKRIHLLSVWVISYPEEKCTCVQNV